MAKLVLNGSYTIGSILSDAFGPSQTRSGTATEYTISAMEGDTLISIVFKGVGFTYDGLGFPTTGTATSCEVRGRGREVAEITGFKANARQLEAMRDVEALYTILGDTEYVGTNGFNVITAAGGDDTIFGFAGADILDGGRGDDRIVAGADDDRIFASAGRDFVSGGGGVDAYDASAFGKAVTIDLDESGYQPVGGSKGAVKLAGVENLTGGARNDGLLGDAKANQLQGLAGDDRLTGRGGDDVLDGGIGSDTINGGGGFDTATYADAEAAVTVTLAVKGPQNTGGAGVDRLQNVEALVGSRYSDNLTGNGAANQLHSGDGDDMLKASGGADTLNGGAGRDQLVGGGGDDLLDGGAGADHLVGGAGGDRFVFASTFEADLDTIAAFDADILDLSAIDAIAGTAANDAFSYGGENIGFSGVAGNMFWYRIDGPGSESAIVVLGDTNGDRAADFKIFVLESKDLTLADFLL